MRNLVKVLGVNIDNITMSEGCEIIFDFLHSKSKKTIFTPNSEILYEAYRDLNFTDILNSGDLVLPDGIGVVIASKFYGTMIKERVAGFDLMNELIKIAYREKKNIYLLGAKPGIAQIAKDKLEKHFKGIGIVGYHDGYFDEIEESMIIEDINKKNTDIVLVALGAPKQEKWISINKKKLDVSILMGVGGSFDVLSGEVKRAPEFYQRAGLEWFYRLMKEPWRIKRMMRLPKFLFLSLYDAISLNKK